MTQTILITGGAGFVGSHLAERLRTQRHRVRIVDDLSTGSASNIAHLLGDDCILFRAKVSDLLTRQPGAFDGVTQVYHLAASVGVQLVVDNPGQVVTNNVEETSAAIEIARRQKARILVASTSEVYGKSAAVPLREDGDLVFGPPTGPRWSYAVSKAADEHLALSYHAESARMNAEPASGPLAPGSAGERARVRGPDNLAHPQTVEIQKIPSPPHPLTQPPPLLTPPTAVIVRLFNTVGPRQVGHYGMVIPRFVQAAVRGEDLTLYGDGRQTRCFCDVRDVVTALTTLMDDPRHHGQVFNVGSAREITVDALADMVIALAGSKSRKKYVPFDQAYRPGFEDPFRRRVPDVTRIRAAIGWEARIALEQTVQELIEAARAG